jgi:dCTP deaminase
MVLSDRSIRALLGKVVLLANPDAVQPASLDVHVSQFPPRIHEPYYGWYDPNRERPTVEVPWAKDIHTDALHYDLPPLHSCLVACQEWLEMPDDLVAQADGCSTIGRSGLIVHKTAGWIDPGFKGTVTFELFNTDLHASARITPGMRIGQLVFMSMDTAAELGYRGRYLGQREPTGARNKK